VLSQYNMDFPELGSKQSYYISCGSGIDVGLCETEKVGMESSFGLAWHLFKSLAVMIAGRSYSLDHSEDVPS
jgi:hypothetical protein